MRLIDADALERTGLPFQTHGGATFIALGSVRTAPTIDAVPVVRCKDCKHRGGVMGRPPFVFSLCTCAEGLTGAVRDENYCSYGERKDGE